MNRRPEDSGCWYCMTDFDSALGCYDSIEFDTVLHVECLEYEHNYNRTGYDDELNLIMRELDYFEEGMYEVYSKQSFNIFKEALKYD